MFLLQIFKAIRHKDIHKVHKMRVRDQVLVVQTLKNYLELSEMGEHKEECSRCLKRNGQESGEKLEVFTS